MVVAISTISYASYVLQKLTKGQGGVVLAAVLGGAYSSTVTTVVMARRAKRELRPHLFAGGILIACGMMYLRLVILLALFNRQLMLLLYIPFWRWPCRRSAWLALDAPAERIRRRCSARPSPRIRWN